MMTESHGKSMEILDEEQLSDVVGGSGKINTLVEVIEEGADILDQYMQVVVGHAYIGETFEAANINPPYVYCITDHGVCRRILLTSVKFIHNNG